MLSETEFKEKFDQQVKSAKKIAILSHKGADEDSYSSTILIHAYLTLVLKLEKDIKIFAEGTPIERVSNFSNFNLVNFVENLPPLLEPFDLIIILDISVAHLLSNNKDDFIKAIENKNLINIDHHTSIDDSLLRALTYRVPRQSNSINIYSIFFKSQLGQLPLYIGEHIILGLLGDSDQLISSKEGRNFESYEILANVLKEMPNLTVFNVFEKIKKPSELSYKYYKEALDNLVVTKVNDYPTVAYTFLNNPQESYSQFDFLNAKEYLILKSLKRIEGVVWSFFLIEKKDTNEFAVSLRSSVNLIDMGKIAAAFSVSGGGHVQAAAFRVPKNNEFKTKQDVINIFIEFLRTTPASDFALT